MKKAVLTLGFVCLLLPSIACTCLTTLEKLNSKEAATATEAFVGKVVEVIGRERANLIRITFKIEEPLLGQKKGDLVEVWTRFDVRDCGIEVQKGERWFIFSTWHANRNWIDQCGRSVNLNGLHNLKVDMKKDPAEWKTLKYNKLSARVNEDIGYLRHSAFH